VNPNVLFILDFAQGPLFRFALALTVLGLLRRAFLGFSDMVGAYLTTEQRRFFWQRLGARVVWFFFPHLLLRGTRYSRGGAGLFLYHSVLFIVSLLFRLGAVLVPAFMAAHVYLWQRGFGVPWPSLPTSVADVLTVATIAAGLVLFLGRLYSPMLRAVEPAWSFLQPLLLILPFVTGWLSRHPTWSPLDYPVTMLLHVLSGVIVLLLIPFARMFSAVHMPIARLLPDMQWRGLEAESAPAAPGDTGPTRPAAAT